MYVHVFVHTYAAELYVCTYVVMCWDSKLRRGDMYVRMYMHISVQFPEKCGWWLMYSSPSEAAPMYIRMYICTCVVHHLFSACTVHIRTYVCTYNRHICMYIHTYLRIFSVITYYYKCASIHTYVHIYIFNAFSVFIQL